jgi:alpha-galactosidase
MIMRLLKRIAVFSFLSVCVLSLSVTNTYASPVTISQTGSVVTATNGMLTITYDLSIGKGNLSAGSTSLIGNFYSDYGVSGSSTRISSYDSGTRTASWVAIAFG